MEETYEIIPQTTWDNRVIHVLYVDNIRLSTCNPKKLNQFLETDAKLNDSKAIENWLKWNNL